MVLCYDKSVVRWLAHSLGIPVPHERWVAPADDDTDALDAPLPALVKPAAADGSVGIAPEAVVRTPDELRRYLRRLREELPGRALLVQEYLPGAEYGMALVGNPGSDLEPFPPLEVDYSELPPGLPPILAFESKTGPETAYSKIRVRRAQLDDASIDTMRRHATLLFERLGCRDYARFDFRRGSDSEIKLLEVNPNPAWSSGGKLAQMARFAGVGYAELLARIVETAEARLRGRSELAARTPSAARAR
jgi:D-alanine-D-alanine ligase